MSSLLKHHYALPILSLAVGIAACSLLMRVQHTPHLGDSPVLRMHCAAGIKNALEPSLEAFTSRTGIHVEVTYGGSGVLLSDFRTRPDGVDLFLAADDEYTRSAKEYGLIDTIVPLAQMRPVIAYEHGNPHHIHGLDDLVHPTLRVALAHPETAAIGKCTKQILTHYGYWDTLRTQAVVCKPTVNELANDLKLNAVDAAITWDATARQYPEIDFICPPEFHDTKSTVSIGISARTRMLEAAQTLTHDLRDTKRGGVHFEAWGYELIPHEHHPTHIVDEISP